MNEPIRFDIKVFSYPLAEPAAAVRGITGTAGGAPRTFLLEIDFIFSPATNVVTWLDDGTKPDDPSTFYVDYFRVDSRSPISDINVGSVTRTLSEAIGREIATVYEQINLAYLSAFVDTATGKSLDYVVSILDVVRKTAEFAEGLVTFFRSSGVDGNITIPAAIGLTTATGAVVFTSTQPRTLQRGQVRIDVPVRAGVGFAGDAGLVPAGAITEMAPTGRGHRAGEQPRPDDPGRGRRDRRRAAAAGESGAARARQSDAGGPRPGDPRRPGHSGGVLRPERPARPPFRAGHGHRGGRRRTRAAAEPARRGARHPRRRCARDAGRPLRVHHPADHRHHHAPRSPHRARPRSGATS